MFQVRILHLLSLSISLISMKTCFNMLLAVCFVTVEMLSGFLYRCICQIISRSTVVLVPLSVFKAFHFFAKSSTSFSSNGTMLTGNFFNSCCCYCYCCCCSWCCFETRSYSHCCYCHSKSFRRHKSQKLIWNMVARNHCLTFSFKKCRKPLNLFPRNAVQNKV